MIHQGLIICTIIAIMVGEKHSYNSNYGHEHVASGLYSLHGIPGISYSSVSLALILTIDYIAMEGNGDNYTSP